MRTLLWLRWREALDEIAYWLRLFDYDLQDRSLSNRAYTLYLLIFFLWWTIGVVAIVSTFAVSYGQGLEPNLLTQVRSYAPAAIFVAQIGLGCSALRTSPFKLTTPDMAYLSNASGLRLPLILTKFVMAVALPMLIGCGAGYFGTLIFSSSLTELQLYASAVLNAVMVGLATVATVSLAWLLGLLRMSLDRPHRVSWLWFTPLPLLALLLISPSPVRAFWRPYTALLFTQSNGASLWLPQLVLFVIGVVGLGIVSRQVDMNAVREESAPYAQLQAIGNLRLVAPSAFERAERDIKSTRVRARLRLPETGRTMTLMTRSMLAFVRRPGLFLQIITAATLMTAAVGIAFSHISPLALVAWLYGAMLLPTSGLAYVFRIDTEDDYLRQFLRVGPLTLLASESFFATSLTVVLGTLGILTQFAAHGTPALGIALIVCLSGLLTACHGASLVPLTPYHIRSSHGVLVMLAFGASLGAGMVLGSAAAVLSVSALCLLILAWLIAKSSG